MKDILYEHKDTLRIVMDPPNNKGYIRFLPTEWNVPQNAGGTGMGAEQSHCAV